MCSVGWPPSVVEPLLLCCRNNSVSATRALPRPRKNRHQHISNLPKDAGRKAKAEARQLVDAVSRAWAPEVTDTDLRVPEERRGLSTGA